MMSEYHQPVLLNESIEWLQVKEGGVYVDATFGGGGHAGAILSRLGDGKLIVFDCDSDAAANCPVDERLIFYQRNFRTLRSSLAESGITSIDGLLADLGVSSHQFDTAGRGFTIRADAPLDMRMDQSLRLTAAEIISSFPVEKLKLMFSRYGEIRQAGRVARAIETARAEAPIVTTGRLMNVIARFAPAGEQNKFFARVFQALRMEVNDELNALKDLLHQSASLIRTGGRLVVISYHSLEDRVVKHFMRTGNTEGIRHTDLKGNLIRPFNPLTGKPVTAANRELRNNPRSRSAKLRAAEKI